MNVKVGSGLGAGVGAGVASGVGTGTTVSDFRTRRPDCATTASAHVAASASARLTLKVLETFSACIDSFFPSKTREGARGYMHLHRCENLVCHGPSGFNNFTVTVDARSS